MLIYLDANVIQYCADYGDYIFGLKDARRPPNPKLEMELDALGDVVELAVRAEVLDLEHRWDVAAPRHLLDELLRGRLTPEQIDTYRTLRDAWRDLGVDEYQSPDVEAVNAVDQRLQSLNLKHRADQRHLAEAVAMRATWFLTLDKEILKKTRKVPSEPGMIEGVIAARPSELRARMTFDPVFGLRVVTNGVTSPAGGTVEGG